MKKLLATTAVLSALAFAPSQAAEAPGCATVPTYTGAESGADQTCSYTALGAGQYAAATPNAWSIVVERNGEVVFSASSDSLGFPTRGDLPTQAGDTVTVTQENDCVEEPICGHGGFVGAAG